MQPSTMMRNLAIPSLLTLTLALSMPAAALAGGPGGGGGRGGGDTTNNPLVGTWAGIPYGGLFRYQFTFTNDFQFTLVEFAEATGQVTATVAGRYVLGGFGPDGFPLITMYSQGQIFLKEEYSAAFEGIALRGTIFIIIGRL